MTEIGSVVRARGTSGVAQASEHCVNERQQQHSLTWSNGQGWRLFQDPETSNLADAVVEASIRSDERIRIGRELHDSTSQLLVALELQLMRLERPSSWSNARFAELRAELRETLAGIRQEIRDLEIPPISTVRDFAVKLKAMATSFAARTGFRIRIRIDDLPDEASPRELQTFFRVAQEALANASRHGRPHQVRLSVNSDPGAITLCVEDDGAGFPMPFGPPLGRGLANMKARLDEVGGELNIRHGPRGTLVEAKLSLVSETQNAVRVRTPERITGGEGQSDGKGVVVIPISPDRLQA